LGRLGLEHFVLEHLVSNNLLDRIRVPVLTVFE
jgi:hypothetical protein